MAQRTCGIDGCERPHEARGLCKPHWKAEYGKRTRYRITCTSCGDEHWSSRKDGKFCSDECKGRLYSLTMATRCQLPADHPVRLEMMIQALERRRARKRSSFEWRTARECPGCGCMFTPLHTPNMLTCSKRCGRRVHRWRRNASERNALGAFTWSEFMRVAQRFDYCCAYCGDRPGSLDPDHVVPLSRGGSNSTTNLLPSCRLCNGDKRDLLLDEWALDRETRGKPPRATNWAPEDKRYWHLTDAILTLPAA